MQLDDSQLDKQIAEIRAEMERLYETYVMQIVTSEGGVIKVSFIWMNRHSEQLYEQAKRMLKSLEKLKRSKEGKP